MGSIPISCHRFRPWSRCVLTGLHRRSHIECRTRETETMGTKTSLPTFHMSIIVGVREVRRAHQCPCDYIIEEEGVVRVSGVTKTRSKNRSVQIRTSRDCLQHGRQVLTAIRGSENPRISARRYPCICPPSNCVSGCLIVEYMTNMLDCAQISAELLLEAACTQKRNPGDSDWGMRVL